MPLNKEQYSSRNKSLLLKYDGQVYFFSSLTNENDLHVQKGQLWNEENLILEEIEVPFN